MATKFRDYFFYKDKNLSNTDTLLIDINLVDPISYIVVEMEVQNYASVVPDHDLADYIKSIEIIDGSEVIESLDMKGWIALNFFENGILPAYSHSEVSGATITQTCIIPFGRYKDDLNFYFNPAVFRNPQLKIDVAFSDIGSGHFAAGTVKATVKARCIMEGYNDYEGFLSTKEIYSFTSGASGEELINLPRDYPYRSMLIKALKTEVRPYAILSRLKLSCDAGRYIERDSYMTDIIESNQSNIGLAQYRKRVDGGHNVTALSMIYDALMASVSVVDTDYIGSVEAITAEKITYTTYNMTTPGTPAFGATGTLCDVIVQGNCPYGYIYIPFGNSVDSDAWFNPSDYGSVELALTQAAAGDCGVIVQQLRT